MKMSMNILQYRCADVVKSLSFLSNEVTPLALHSKDSGLLHLRKDLGSLHLYFMSASDEIFCKKSHWLQILELVFIGA